MCPCVLSHPVSSEHHMQCTVLYQRGMKSFTHGFSCPSFSACVTGWAGPGACALQLRLVHYSAHSAGQDRPLPNHKETGNFAQSNVIPWEGCHTRMLGTGVQVQTQWHCMVISTPAHTVVRLLCTISCGVGLHAALVHYASKPFLAGRKVKLVVMSECTHDIQSHDIHI